LTWILRILIFFLGEFVKGRMVLRAKRRGVVTYLKALQGSRRILLIAVSVFFVFNVVALAGIGTFVTGVMLLDLDQRQKLWILFGVFAALFFIPVIALVIAFNERVWYKMSGAEKMVEDLRLEPEESKAA